MNQRIVIIDPYPDTLIQDLVAKNFKLYQALTNRKTVTIENQLPYIIDSVVILNQFVDLAVQPLKNSNIPGLYRLNYYLQCIELDAGAGNLELDITYTDEVGANTITITLALSALDRTSDSLIIKNLITPISYQATLLSGAYGTAKFNLNIVLEKLL